MSHEQQPTPQYHDEFTKAAIVLGPGDHVESKKQLALQLLRDYHDPDFVMGGQYSGPSYEDMVPVVAEEASLADTRSKWLAGMITELPDNTTAIPGISMIASRLQR